MKKSTYTTYDELPLFLNADLVAQVLGICNSDAHRPATPIGRDIHRFSGISGDFT